MDVGTRDEAKRKSIEVFCCYARKDQPFLSILKTHLAPLQHEGLITLRADIDIDAGEEWEQEIQRYLNTAQIILLLISPDFIGSDYCYSVEMQRALERHERGEARVIPIILRPASWRETPLVKLQAIPKNAKPITTWRFRDQAFIDVSEKLRDAVEALARKNPAPQVHSPDQAGEDVAGISFSPNSRAEGVRIRQAEEGKTRFVEEAARTRRTEEERQRRGVQEMAHQVDEEHLRENERATHAPLPLSTVEARSAIHRTPHLPTGRLARQIILLIVVLLVIGGSTSFFIIRNNQIASDHAHATTTAQAAISARLAATAQAHATADAIGLHNPYSGKLALDDPMKDNSKGYDWPVISNIYGNDGFSGGAYHIRAVKVGYVDDLIAYNTDFSNFTYQIEMTIIKGTYGGIIFRHTEVNGGQEYYLQLGRDGSYGFFILITNSSTSSLLKTGFSTAIKTDLNQSNIVAVVAYNDFFYMYINGKFITSLEDKTFSHGSIGAAASSANGPAEVVFRNAKVWTF